MQNHMDRTWTIWSYENDVVLKNSNSRWYTSVCFDLDKILNLVTNKYPKVAFSYFDWCLCLIISKKSLTF